MKNSLCTRTTVVLCWFSGGSLVVVVGDGSKATLLLKLLFLTLEPSFRKQTKFSSNMHDSFSIDRQWWIFHWIFPHSLLCSPQPHRISVRSVTVNRKTSKDAACTMIIGKDAPLGPSCVRASNVTSTSAVISWLPSNSNFQHTVCINNVEVRTVKPGTYKHTITGLTPNTVYKVTVRAKNIKASPFVDEKSLVRLLEKLSAHTEFRTLNKGTRLQKATLSATKGHGPNTGQNRRTAESVRKSLNLIFRPCFAALPDPPMDVRVDGGPQDGTILVTWIPVTLNTTSLRHVPVTGYAVFADGKRVTDVDSPSSDHALVDLGCIGHFNPKLITVRSKSGDLLSNDSSAVPIQASTRTRRAARVRDFRGPLEAAPSLAHKYKQTALMWQHCNHFDTSILGWLAGTLHRHGWWLRPRRPQHI